MSFIDSMAPDVFWAAGADAPAPTTSSHANNLLPMRDDIEVVDDGTWTCEIKLLPPGSLQRICIRDGPCSLRPKEDQSPQPTCRSTHDQPTCRSAHEQPPPLPHDRRHAAVDEVVMHVFGGGSPISAPSRRAMPSPDDGQLVPQTPGQTYTVRPSKGFHATAVTVDMDTGGLSSARSNESSQQLQGSNSPSNSSVGVSTHTADARCVIIADEAASAAELVTKRRRVARQRWHLAGAAVREVRRLHKMAALLQDAAASPSDRLYAAVRLKMQAAGWGGLLARCPHKDLLRLHLVRKRRGLGRALGQRIETEMYLTGSYLFDMCTPSKLDHHISVFVPLLAFFLVAVFLFMAGQYAYFVAYRQAVACKLSPSATSCGSTMWLTSATHADALVVWFFHSGRPEAQFSFDFMLAWGGRYSPALAAGQAYRWVTGSLVHVSARHLLGNLLLLLLVGVPLEVKFGALPVAAVWCIAVVGGALFSAAVEDPCVLVVGASAGICGLLGFFIGDLGLSYRALQRPLLKLFATALGLAVFLYTTLSQPNVSVFSHVGGLVCGVLPGLLIQPTLHMERWEAALPLVGVLGIVVVFVTLPVWLYTSVLQQAALAARCGSSKPGS